MSKKHRAIQWLIIAIWFLSIFLAGVNRMLVKNANAMVLYLIITSCLIALAIEKIGKNQYKNDSNNNETKNETNN